MPEPDYVLEGERVALGPLRTDLAETYRRWIHDLDVRRGVLNPGIYGQEPEEAWVRDALDKSAGLQPELAAFTIYERGDGEPVGTCSLFAIEWRLRRATFGILLGARRGQGLGTEAARLSLDWAFHVLGLGNVMLEVLPDNAAAIRSYERAGFRHVGIRRSSVVARGRTSDALLMDAVPIDFVSPVLAAR
jgi:diamine N-acetyltransferase